MYESKEDRIWKKAIGDLTFAWIIFPSTSRQKQKIQKLVLQKCFFFYFFKLFSKPNENFESKPYHAPSKKTFRLVKFRRTLILCNIHGRKIIKLS